MPIIGPPTGIVNRVRGVTGDQIASDALRYRGRGYVFGGTARAPGDWDCSSFVSYVLGHDLHLALPGGKWGGAGEPPGSHGPVVLSYSSWSGASPVSSPARGDLVCWPGAGADGHIGIVLGPNQMVSALDSSQGTLVTPIQGYGPPGITPVYRRVKGVSAGTATGPVPAGGGPAGTGQAASAAGLALLIVMAMAGAVVLGAAVLGVGVAALGTWALAQAGGRG